MKTQLTYPAMVAHKRNSKKNKNCDSVDVALVSFRWYKPNGNILNMQVLFFENKTSLQFSKP